MNGVRIGSFGDIPFFVSPWYLVLAFYGAAMIGDVTFGGLWVLCLTVSLAVHELGHALVARRLRLSPRILLHGFGGLCMHERAERDAHDVAIVAAGPAAGLALGAVSFAVLYALRTFSPETLANPMVGAGLRWMVWLNIFWSLVNLIPMWPLDGGQLFRLGMMRVFNPARAEKVTHTVGIVLALAAIGAASALGFGRFAIVVAGLIGFANYQALRGDRSSGPVRSRNRFARGLAQEARAAFDAGDDATCIRLCHQLRSEPRIPSTVLADVWRMLGIATARQGNHREAVSYLRRAPLDAEVGETWLRCLLNEGDRNEEIAELLESDAWRRLGARGQSIVDRLAAEHAGEP